MSNEKLVICLILLVSRSTYLRFDPGDFATDLYWIFVVAEKGKFSVFVLAVLTKH